MIKLIKSDCHTVRGGTSGNGVEPPELQVRTGGNGVEPPELQARTSGSGLDPK
ncbi:hypothetical protein JJQ94_16770 [Pseudoalteromonas sp. GCY]|uniref:hypothetical protein n=1 Tax=Pseudoalteromonas sp. GCY TaxID=2003316 RepID=UPI0015569C68|nr:hypothetical protein [Pseudoalteromonas sp. GCY]QQQ65952.1 hypothetical protein JJQ94_16770 [Pseudoalteromonas sp. GCY]